MKKIGNVYIVNTFNSARAGLKARRAALSATGVVAAAALPLGLVATVVPTAVAADANTGAGTDGLGSRFSLGVLPDTQFYSRYTTPETGNLAKGRYASEPYRAQTEWLAEHQDELNMPFATHLGDVVDQSEVDGEWKVADDAMSVLDNSQLNYSILPGNHDLWGSQDEVEKTPEGTTTPYSHYFSAERAAGNETFQGRFDKPNRESEYHIFEAEGQKYLVLAMAWRADDEALDWAQKAIDEHPDLPVILTTHEALNIDGEGNVFYSEAYGEHLWDKFIKKNDQVFLVMGGHHHGAGYRVDHNDAGHDVVSILQDYQMAYQGGNGLMGVLEFDLTGNELEMQALSPWVAAKPADSLTQFDEVTLEGKGDSYHVPLNFAERFHSFAPDWRAGDENESDLAGAARDIVTAGYKPYEIPAEQLPHGTDDYVRNERTVFHWRPGQATKDGAALHDGDQAGAGTVIPDQQGGSDMHREGGDDARVTYSEDHHPLSSDSGSLFWNNPTGERDINWFKTADGAPANAVETPEGYTFETFVKLPKDFDGDKNGWGNAVGRENSIEKVKPGTDDSDPTVMFGVSNLRELRWWAEPAEGEGATVWSHEVPKDEWMHIAVVNNPETETVEMFINGAPILRNHVGAEGLWSSDVAWILGAGMGDNHPQDPWYGWIGETRLTQGVLDESDWLTARPHGSKPNGDKPSGSVPGLSSTSSDLLSSSALSSRF